MPIAITRLALCLGLILPAFASAQTTTTAAAPATTASAARPNIIFIMADDLGQETLACYGNDINKTPNLDRLAASGMRFTQAYATPLCSPSRVQVMTGKYNNRNYLVFGLIDKDEKTFADYLKAAGYTTGIAGKWQLYGRQEQQERAGGQVGSRPQEVGFDQYCLWQVDELGSRYKNPTVTTTTGTQTVKNGYGPDVFSDFAISFLRENRNRPFMFYYPLVHTHAPFQPTPDSPNYATAPVKGEKDPKYYPDDIAYMDKKIGRLLEEVEALGLTTNTLIIFTGDNGTDKSIVSTVNGQKIHGEKGNSTHYGTNVPLIVSWPGKIKPGQVNDNLVDFTDMLPTFLEAAGQPVPTDAGLDGISYYPQLLGRPATPRPWVFCYYAPELRNHLKLIWAHDKTYKLYSDGRFYNMATDPLEQSPLAEAPLSPEAQAAKATLQKAINQKLAKPAKPKQ